MQNKRWEREEIEKFFKAYTDGFCEDLKSKLGAYADGTQNKFDLIVFLFKDFHRFFKIIKVLKKKEDSNE